MPFETLRTQVEDHVFVITLSRAKEYNTITPKLREELGRAIDDAEESREARVILLRGEGPAFCAGYALDWGTAAQASDPTGEAGARNRVWDSVSDMRMMGRFVDTYMKLW